MEPLRILLSAYACGPDTEGEAALGWRWVLETAALGHEVWVLTRQANRFAIESGAKTLAAMGRLPRLRFVFVDLPAAGKVPGRWRYAAWQWRAYREARELHRQHRFDAVHHLTGSDLHQPTFMGRLGVPLILGPLHGGERIAPVLRRTLPWNLRLRETMRALGLRVAAWDPLLRRGFRQAALILVRTPGTAAGLPLSAATKSRCLLDAGVDLPSAALEKADQASTTAKVELPRQLRLLFTGPSNYEAGLGLAMEALADLHRRGVAASLTVIGVSPEAEPLRGLAHRLGVSSHVVWRARMNREARARCYGEFDALLYPCLRDGDPGAILEALGHALPVVCLQSGVPAELVDSDCGRAIPVHGRNAGDVRHGLTAALAEIAADPWLLQRLRSGALARARQFVWPLVVGRVWGPHGVGSQAVIGRGT